MEIECELAEIQAGRVVDGDPYTAEQRYTGLMDERTSFSFARVAGMLCYAFSAFMAVVLAACVANRYGWNSRYRTTADNIAFCIMGLVVVVSAMAGRLCRPGSFSLRTLWFGMTWIAILMAEMVYLTRSK